MSEYRWKTCDTCYETFSGDRWDHQCNKCFEDTIKSLSEVSESSPRETHENIKNEKIS